MILTVDLGTTVTKVILWDGDGMVAQAGSPIETVHPAPGWSEQDPSMWWRSVVDACARVRAEAGARFGPVDAIGFTGARQTMVLADAEGRTLGPAIVWSDHRAGSEASELAAFLGGREPAFDRTGVPLDAGSVAAKVAWLTAHERSRLDASAWVLTPRDLTAWRFTGRVATDPSMASRGGLYGIDGRVVEELAGLAVDRLAPVVPPDQVTGELVPSVADELGLMAGVPVVIGAGDRACEVAGTGATALCPMVSWGTTANLSVPIGGSAAGFPRRPAGMVLSRAADGGWLDGGWLIEGGLSAAGSMLAWLGRITGRRPAELAGLAEQSPPGARGVTATPWLDGARAPWWRYDAAAAFVGITSHHGVADLARAVFESVAGEVRRCAESAFGADSALTWPTGLTLGGGGAGVAVWIEALTGVTGLSATRRRSGQAASVGAALLASQAVGLGYDLEVLDPVEQYVEPDQSEVAQYAELAGRADRVATGLLDLAGPTHSLPAGGHHAPMSGSSDR